MKITHEVLARVQEMTRISRLHNMTEDELFEILIHSSSLLLDGHFELLSERHSDSFLRFSKIAQYPWMMSLISKEMLAWVESTITENIDVVLGTSRAGMWFAYDLARELNGKHKSRAVYAQSDTTTGYPKRKLLDGFTINKGERVLIVNDITTTGKGLRILIDLASKEYSAKVVGASLFATRVDHESQLNKVKELCNNNLHSIVQFDMQSWISKKGCPLCQQGIPYVRSADINSLHNLETVEEVLAPLKPQLMVVGSDLDQQS